MTKAEILSNSEKYGFFEFTIGQQNIPQYFELATYKGSNQMQRSLLISKDFITNQIIESDNNSHLLKILYKINQPVLLEFTILSD